MVDLSKVCTTSVVRDMYNFRCPGYVQLLVSRVCTISGLRGMYNFWSPGYVQLLVSGVCTTSGLRGTHSSMCSGYVQLMADLSHNLGFVQLPLSGICRAAGIWGMYRFPQLLGSYISRSLWSLQHALEYNEPQRCCQWVSVLPTFTQRTRLRRVRIGRDLDPGTRAWLC